MPMRSSTFTRRLFTRSFQQSYTYHTLFNLYPFAMASCRVNYNSSADVKLKQQRRPQNFDFFLVLDFEATCDNNNQPRPQEIIEFPVLKVNALTGNVDSIFHQYVLPEVHSQLTPFCTELTGIVQDMVNGQPNLNEVLENFHKWMLSEKLLEPDTRSIFVTCGDWDLKVMLPKQTNYFGMDPQNYFKRWINIKKAYAELTGVFPKGMMPMLNDLHLKHTGRHHSGIDDCHNIANILTTMIQRGYTFHQTGSLS